MTSCERKTLVSVCIMDMTPPSNRRAMATSPGQCESTATPSSLASLVLLEVANTPPGSEGTVPVRLFKMIRKHDDVDVQEHDSDQTGKSPMHGHHHHIQDSNSMSLERIPEDNIVCRPMPSNGDQDQRPSRPKNMSLRQAVKRQRIGLQPVMFDIDTGSWMIDHDAGADGRSVDRNDLRHGKSFDTTTNHQHKDHVPTMPNMTIDNIRNPGVPHTEEEHMKKDMAMMDAGDKVCSISATTDQPGGSSISGNAVITNKSMDIDFVSPAHAFHVTLVEKDSI